MRKDLYGTNSAVTTSSSTRLGRTYDERRSLEDAWLPSRTALHLSWDRWTLATGLGRELRSNMYHTALHISLDYSLLSQYIGLPEPDVRY